MIKGKATIQLFDEKTGEVVRELHEENMITNAVDTIESRSTDIRFGISGYRAMTSPFPFRITCAYVLPQRSRCVISVSRKTNEVISGFGSSWSRR